MDQISNGDRGDTLPTMPLKRRRGRPRKDKSPKHAEVTNSRPRPLQLNSMGDANEGFVGQPVTGVVEASFDAGYLLNVKIGDSGPCLRGVVFKLGHYLPISATDDVAPHAETISRNKVPLARASQNSGYIGSIGEAGYGLPLNGNGSPFESATLNGKVKQKQVSMVLPSQVPSRGMVKPVILVPNGVPQSGESFESVRSGANGIKISSKPSDRNVEDGDGKNKRFDAQPVQVMNPGNDCQSLEAQEPHVNSAMGPMSTLLQALQANVTKPGGSG